MGRRVEIVCGTLEAGDPSTRPGPSESVVRGTVILSLGDGTMRVLKDVAFAPRLYATLATSLGERALVQLWVAPPFLWLPASACAVRTARGTHYEPIEFGRPFTAAAVLLALLATALWLAGWPVSAGIALASASACAWAAASLRAVPQGDVVATPPPRMDGSSMAATPRF